MKDNILIILFVFTICKLFFSFLGWYTREEGDLIYRERLDEIWDNLQTGTLYDLIQYLLKKFIVRIRDSFPTKTITLKYFIIISVIINLLSVIIAQLIYSYLSIGEFSFFNITLLILKNEQFSIHLFAVIILILFSVAFDFLSLWITWKLLNRAALSLTLPRVAFHIFLDVLIMLIATWWSLLGLICTNLSFNGLYTFYPEYTLITKMVMIINADWLGAGLNTIYATLCISISTVLPTLVYITICIIAIIAYFSPKFVHNMISRFIYLVTTDDKPVMSQLGNVVGAFSSIVTAFIKFL